MMHGKINKALNWILNEKLQNCPANYQALTGVEAVNKNICNNKRICQSTIQ
jgi:hypothetical protein